MKFCPVTFALFMFSEMLVGENVYLFLLGVIVYVPLASPVKVYVPLPFVLVDPVAVPLKVRVTPAIGLPPDVATFPEIEKVAVVLAVPVKFWPITFPLFTVTGMLVGENV